MRCLDKDVRIFFFLLVICSKKITTTQFISFNLVLQESFSNKYISEIEGVNLKKQKEKDERDKTFKKRGKKLKTRMANKLVQKCYLQNENTN